LKPVGKVRQELGAVLGDSDQILDTAAAEAMPVEAWLERENVPFDKHIGLGAAHVRRLVRFETDTMAQRVEEAISKRAPAWLGQLSGMALRLKELADELI
jgi:hypothetical protein